MAYEARVCKYEELGGLGGKLELLRVRCPPVPGVNDSSSNLS